MKHPWFLDQLPAGALQMNRLYTQCSSGLEQVAPSSDWQAPPPQPQGLESAWHPRFGAWLRV